MLDFEHMTVTNETMTFMKEMLPNWRLCNMCRFVYLYLFTLQVPGGGHERGLETFKEGEGCQQRWEGEAAAQEQLQHRRDQQIRRQERGLQRRRDHLRLQLQVAGMQNWVT